MLLRKLYRLIEWEGRDEGQDQYLQVLWRDIQSWTRPWDK